MFPKNHHKEMRNKVLRLRRMKSEREQVGKELVISPGCSFALPAEFSTHSS